MDFKLQTKTKENSYQPYTTRSPRRAPTWQFALVVGWLSKSDVIEQGFNFAIAFVLQGALFVILLSGSCQQRVVGSSGGLFGWC